MGILENEESSKSGNRLGLSQEISRKGPPRRHQANRQAPGSFICDRTAPTDRIRHMVTLNAHFDGKAIIPDEPTGLAVGTRLRVTLEPIEPTAVEPTAEPQRFRPLSIHIAPELSNAIAQDPEFDLQES